MSARDDATGTPAGTEKKRYRISKKPRVELPAKRVKPLASLQVQAELLWDEPSPAGDELWARLEEHALNHHLWLTNVQPGLPLQIIVEHLSRIWRPVLAGTQLEGCPAGAVCTVGQQVRLLLRPAAVSLLLFCTAADKDVCHGHRGPHDLIPGPKGRGCTSRSNFMNALATYPDSSIILAAEEQHLGRVGRFERRDAPTVLRMPTSALLDAAARGDAAHLRALLDSVLGTPTSDDKADRGQGPLSACCAFGHDECVQLLLDRQGAGDQLADSTPLRLACQEGHPSCVQLLLRANANPTPKLSEGELSPLFLSCRNGHTECLRLLLEVGEHTCSWVVVKGSPLHTACEHGHVECARLLVESGFPIDTLWLGNLAANSLDPVALWTPLMVACFNAELACATLLIEAGARNATQHKILEPEPHPVSQAPLLCCRCHP